MANILSRILKRRKKLEAQPLAPTPAPELANQCQYCKSVSEKLYRPTLEFWPENIVSLTRFPVRVTFGTRACARCTKTIEPTALINPSMLESVEASFKRKGFRAIEPALTVIKWEQIR